MDFYDAVIIGAGPAGLSAGIYLARFRRKVLIIDAEKGRSTLAGTYHNIMGFAEPIERIELRRLGTQQALKYGAQKVWGEVSNIKITEQGQFEILCKDSVYFAKNIIFCTGVMDIWPEIKGYQDYLGYCIHSCIICSGYESINKKIIAVGYDDRVSKFVLEIMNFTEKITIITNGIPLDIQEEHLYKIKKLNIPIFTDKIAGLIGENHQLKRLILDNDTEIDVDIIYSTLGIKVNSSLAEKSGVLVDERKRIIVDQDQKTNIKGIYAAGDVTNFDNKQVVTAMYEGFIAAISVHSRLLRKQIEQI